MGTRSRQKEFDRIFRGHIEAFSPLLVPVLRRIVTTKPPAIVKVLLFQVQSDWRDFPVTSFATDDESPDEVYFKRPFYGSVLPKSQALIPKGAIDQDEYESHGIDTFESGACVLAEWFGECWQVVGGRAFPIPAYINHHDRDQYFDLRARRWVKEADVWPD